MKMPPCFRWIMIALLCPIILTLPGCSSGEDDSPYSVGGTVRGLDGAGLILQLNGVENLNVSIDGPFNFASQVSGNTSYNVIVSVQPTSPNQFCTVGKGSGNGANGNVSDVIVNCSSVMPVYQTNGGNWLDHVVSDNTSPTTRAACTLSVADNGLGACIHGGERRTWNSGQAGSCSTVTVTDSLGVFNWLCEDSGGTQIVVTSGGFKDGKKLSDLIDFTAAPPQWKPNRVVLSGNVNATSPSEIWWANPIIIASGGGGGLTQTGGIYLINASTTGGYSFRTNKSALVIKPSATLISPTNTYAVYGQDLQYLWLEGKINGNGVGRGVLFSSVAASVLRGVTVSSSINPGIELDYSQGNHLIDVVSNFNGSNAYVVKAGVYLYQCWKNALTNVSTSSNLGEGIVLNLSDNNRLTGLATSNNGSHGLLFLDAAHNVAANVTAANNTSTGVFLTNSTNTTQPSVNNLLIGVVSANNGIAGVEASIDSNNTLADIATAHNVYSGVGVFSTDNYFTGLLKVGDNNGGNGGFQCTGGSGTGIEDDCTNEGASSNATLTTSITLATSFAGKNPSGSPVGPVTVGINSSGTFPSSDNRGPCVAGTCTNWNWGLRSTDNVLRAVRAKPTGNDVLPHYGSFFLRRAVEISGDGIGNDDLLCQSNETCLWTKNIGAYQGHGPLISAGSFSAGTLPGISLLEFTTNGN